MSVKMIASNDCLDLYLLSTSWHASARSDVTPSHQNMLQAYDIHLRCDLGTSLLLPKSTPSTDTA